MLANQANESINYDKLSLPTNSINDYFGEIAKAIGSPKAYRAVSNACSGNNVALVIPCHRVIRGEGTSGGYRWGEEIKRAIIDLEHKKTPSQ